MKNGKKIVVTISSDLAPLAAGYIKNRQRDVEALRDSLTREDYEAMRIIGHSMKGSGGGYGFERITELGRGLELAAKAKDAASLSSLADELSDYLSRLDIVYE